MNAAAYAVLSKSEAVEYVGPVNPPAITRQKALSKLLRLMHSGGDFFWFSKQRLAAIADDVASRCQEGARLDFFHGFTPWILTTPARPYVAWSDCTFRDYIDIFHCRRRFRSSDLERIETAEATWLKNARRVLFTSEWAAERAVRQYALDARRVHSVGIFGEVEPPTRDVYAGGKEFGFVSTNFEAKGGPIVLAAFRSVRRRHPDASLIVVGDHPPDRKVEAGVAYTGFLRKEVPEEYRRFEAILGRVRAVVNATRCDISPVLFVEAGYLGCPVISSRKFAIPELVDDRRTGLLVTDPSDAALVAEAMCWMLEHEEEYRVMRQAAWVKARTQNSKGRFEERLRDAIGDRCPQMSSIQGS